MSSSSAQWKADLCCCKSVGEEGWRWSKCSHAFYFHFSYESFCTGSSNLPWKVWERRQAICYQLRCVSQRLSIELLTAIPLVAKHVNVIELCGAARDAQVCGWRLNQWEGEVCFFCRLFGQRKPMQRRRWAQCENRGRGRKKRKPEGVKGIYCQEPSISGNGYACIGVNQTCCFSSSMTEVEKTTKVKLTATLRGINRKLIFQHLRLHIRSQVYTWTGKKWLLVCLEWMIGGEVVKVYSGRNFYFCHIPVKLQQEGQEHMAKCLPSWLKWT